MRLLILTVHADSGLVKMENLETIAESYREIILRNHIVELLRNHIAKSCREIIALTHIAEPLRNYCGTIVVAFIKAHSLSECKLQIPSKLPAGRTR